MNRHHFLGGKGGCWNVTAMHAFRGSGLEVVKTINVLNGDTVVLPEDTRWHLQGVTSNVRYATSAEISALKAVGSRARRPPCDF